MQNILAHSHHFITIFPAKHLLIKIYYSVERFHLEDGMYSFRNNNNNNNNSHYYSSKYKGFYSQFSGSQIAH